MAPFRSERLKAPDAEPASTASTRGCDEEEEEMFLLAKAYFDLKEYRRCAHALRTVAGPKALFLRCYSQYLAGEKRKAEEVVELAGMNAGRGAHSYPHQQQLSCPPTASSSPSP
jgi:anaphase-promoting complex subunit 8